MLNSFRFERILNVKEREKKEAEGCYREAMETFEKTARKLYQLLKKKELMEDAQSAAIINGLSVQKLRHTQQFLLNIEKSISFQQKLVVESRSAMQWHEEELKKTAVEVKKYEKLRENDQLHFVAVQKVIENEKMNEISIIQYLNHKNR
ncbi:flagellar export protein FliJ [Jeotgalibacillus sp. S-D1]|uniref:flagellar export protein FliJ n=1 Tax=Jeotgalibacillus sp. S-D1 TaxID=2552189 RepID=UPI001405393C|nr:flagellar export protein FliJ [Jeotgalibacillus sp. S-D1]